MFVTVLDIIPLKCGLYHTCIDVPTTLCYTYHSMSAFRCVAWRAKRLHFNTLLVCRRERWWFVHYMAHRYMLDRTGRGVNPLPQHTTHADHESIIVYNFPKRICIREVSITPSQRAYTTSAARRSRQYAVCYMFRNNLPAALLQSRHTRSCCRSCADSCVCASAVIFACTSMFS